MKQWRTTRKSPGLILEYSKGTLVSFIIHYLTNSHYSVSAIKIFKNYLMIKIDIFGKNSSFLEKMKFYEG